MEGDSEMFLKDFADVLSTFQASEKTNIYLSA